MLSNTLIKNFIQAIDEGWLYQSGNDFSVLMQHGISVREITLLEHTVCSLRAEPYLTKEELMHRGISKTLIDKYLGGMNNIRELLGIQEYGFIDYLEQYELDLDKGVILSYYHYQTFVDDIREHFRADKECAIPVPELQVELSSDCAINAIPILYGDYKAVVPATDFEAIVVAMGLIAKDYNLITSSKHQSTLTVHPFGQDREIEIEVRCLASQFSQATDKGICVVDDISAMHHHPSKQRVFDFASLIKRNGYILEE
ncbi:hypothetical protein REH81_24780 [Vibrio rotiferianus]